MKSYRQSAILELVDREAITSQEQLRDQLKLRGIEATQATISRDVRDLGLIKRAADGAYRRSGAESVPAGNPEAECRTAIDDYLRHYDVVEQLVVLKTDTGQAQPLAVAIDRAALKEKAGEFEQLSVTDPLTGLLNRRYMDERLMEEIKRSNRHGYPMSLVMLDVDSFKSYNDQYGHPAGDLALKIVGHVIRETLRGADVAARYGGEEFAILLPQTTNEEAGTIAERIRRNIEAADFPHRTVTASIGIASCSAELCSATNIVSAADKALYSAKHGGRNRVVAFEEMNHAA